MGSNSVCRSLHELFPQVDVRVLKAVAIEFAPNLKEAVESVISDVLPRLGKETKTCSTTSGDHGHNLSVSHERHLPSEPVNMTNAYPFESGSAPAGDVAIESGRINDSFHAAPLGMNVTDCRSPGSAFYDAKDSNDKFVEYAMNNDMSVSDGHDAIASELHHDYSTPGSPIEKKVSGCNMDQENVGAENSWLQKDLELDGNLTVNNALRTSTPYSDTSDHVLDYHLIGGLIVKASCSSDPLASKLNLVMDVSKGKQCSSSSNSPKLDSFVHLETSLKSNTRDIDNSCLLPHLPIKDQAPEAQDDIQLEFEHQTPSSTDTDSNQVIELIARTNNEDSPLVNSVVTRSGQVCHIDLLEDIIDDAKNHKKRLFSAMETVMKLMREVEVKEKDADQAKEEAARGGLEILANVDNLKEMIKATVEANEMHSGEVYGERAILATEVKELQNRLFSLAEERDRQLSILDEMRKTLEARRDAAEMEVMTAQTEKLEKEESARNALAEQEYIMEKVVLESKILKQQAEENERLRDFLDNRGRIVDTLQGEISVICQDVKLLKENFDKRIPLSQYMSLKQTSCILAAPSSFSASSQKSTSNMAAKSGHWMVSSEGTPSESADDASVGAKSGHWMVSSDGTHSESADGQQEEPLGGNKALVMPFWKESSDDDWEAV